ncbi:hypothetical protein K6U47_11405, partial [Vibrio furnissii]|nr:hypothetical protein [Vibrio furnissii]
MNKWHWMSVAVMGCWSLTSVAAHPDFLQPYLAGQPAPAGPRVSAPQNAQARWHGTGESPPPPPP